MENIFNWDRCWILADPSGLMTLPRSLVRTDLGLKSFRFTGRSVLGFIKVDGHGLKSKYEFILHSDTP